MLLRWKNSVILAIPFNIQKWKIEGKQGTIAERRKFSNHYLQFKRTVFIFQTGSLHLFYYLTILELYSQ